MVTPGAGRTGTTTLGCLTWLLVLVAAVYVGIHVSEPYFRYYQYRDAIVQEARFANLRSDDAVRQNIWSNADSLSMPEGAYHLQIVRKARAIRIRTSYEDSWTISSYTRPVHFDIDITGGL
jgi:hypothetical protein